MLIQNFIFLLSSIIFAISLIILKTFINEKIKERKEEKIKAAHTMLGLQHLEQADRILEADEIIRAAYVNDNSDYNTDFDGYYPYDSAR